MAGPLAGSTILVVEDEPLVALDIADCFKGAGAGVEPGASRTAAAADARRGASDGDGTGGAPAGASRAGDGRGADRDY